jgi:hypothetical protein
MPINESNDSNQNDMFPVYCGFVIGSLPALLWIPIIGKIIEWLMQNFYFAIFFIFMIYLPWMIGVLIGNILGIPTLCATVFCMVYWVSLGIYVGKPKYKKMALFYIGIAHFFIPLILLLTIIRPFSNSNLPSFELWQIFKMLMPN